MPTLALAQDRVEGVVELANRTTTLLNDIRQFEDANSALSIPWGGRKVATVGAGDVTANTLTSTAHGFTNGQKVRVFKENPQTGVMPVPIVEITEYYLVGVAANTMQLALTRGGAAIDITGQATGNLLVCPLPDYLTLDNDGNVTGKSNTPQEISDAIGSLAEVRKLMTNVLPTQGDHKGTLSKLARSLG